MADRKTRRLSGAQYRKRKLEKEEEKKKLGGLMEKYVKLSSSETREDVFGISSSEENVGTISEDVQPSTSYLKPLEEDASKISVCSLEDEKSENLENIDFSDPAHWPDIVSSELSVILVKKGPMQVKKFIFPRTELGKFSSDCYNRILSNGEKISRNWVLYSKKLNSVFCFCCKIFGITKTKLTDKGYSDFKHLKQHLSRHETGISHIDNFKKWGDLEKGLSSFSTIDRKEQRLLEMQQKYWYNVIERMIAIIQFLASQCLSFRGTSSVLFEHNNGNFLKAVEMLSKFDPVISEHIKKVQLLKTKKHIPHYLGNRFQNEIISLLAKNIRAEIISMCLKAKYYCIILDSTTDTSHTEQITFVIRFVLEDSKNRKFDIHEHFVGFYPVTDTTGEGLFKFITEELRNLKLDIINMRGQGYDNGANMRGKHIGLQKRILNINPRAMFVPCAAHSLNLVVNDAAKVTLEIADFFNIVQELYLFFSSSSYRWDILKKHISNLVLQSVSTTRWESRIKAVTPLRYQLGEIYDSLIVLKDDNSRDTSTRALALALATKISTFKFVCSVVIWHDILFKVNTVSKMLQSPNLDVKMSLDYLKDLQLFCENKRSNESFENYILIATKLVNDAGLEIKSEFPAVSTMRQRRKKRQFDYESIDEPISDYKQNFKINFYFTLMDQTINSIKERFELLNEHGSTFRVIYGFFEMEESVIRTHCNELHNKLHDSFRNESDIDPIELADELISLRIHIKEIMDPSNLLSYLYEQNLSNLFPNITVVLRILLTLPVSVASGERAFSKLKIIKNYLRSMMSQQRLSDLALISIEKDLSENINMAEFIKSFAAVKARRAKF